MQKHFYRKSNGFYTTAAFTFRVKIDKINFIVFWAILKAFAKHVEN